MGLGMTMAVVRDQESIHQLVLTSWAVTRSSDRRVLVIKACIAIHPRSCVFTRDYGGPSVSNLSIQFTQLPSPK